MNQFPNIPKYEPGYLADFVGDLRAWIFKYKTEAAQHTHIHHTTIGRYEKPDSGIRPPIGYLAYLVVKLVEKRDGEPQLIQITQDGLLQEVNRVIQHEYYQEEKPFENWEELVKIANLYLEERRLIGLQKAENLMLRSSSTQLISHAFTPGSVKNWFNELFKWQEADEHSRSSWAGMFIWSLRAISDRFTSSDFLNLTVTLLIWIATAWLVTPLLQWPLENASLREDAAIRFSIASLVIPIAIGLFTQPDTNEFLTITIKQRINVSFLKLTGAFVGFNTFVVLLLVPVLIGYYLGLPTFPACVCWLFALIPLLFGHIGGRRIPADRYLMFGRDPRLHVADRFFLGVFLFFGIFVAGFLNLQYDLISDPIMGLTILLLLAALYYGNIENENLIFYRIANSS